VNVSSNGGAGSGTRLCRFVMHFLRLKTSGFFGCSPMEFPAI